MKRRLEDVAVYFYAAAALLALCAYAFSGYFTRLWADDYCFSASLRLEGFWAAQVNAYLTTSDRYSVMPLVGVSELFGPHAIRVLPGLAALGWLLSLSWFFFRARSQTSGLGKGEILLLSSHLVLFSLLAAPNLFQVFYWRTGMLTYFMPLVVQVCLGALLLAQPLPGDRPLLSWLRLPGILLLAFFAGGFSETTAALQTTALLLALAAVFIFLKTHAQKSWFLALGVALLGSLLAMLVLFISPAAILRQQRYFVPPPGLWSLLGLTLQFAFDFITLTLRGLVIPALVAGAVPFVLAFRKPSPAAPRRRINLILALLAVWGAVFLLVASCFAPSVYAQSSYAEERAQFPACFVLVCGLSASGWLLGKRIAALPPAPALQKIAVLLLIALSLYPLRLAVLTYAGMEPYRQRAAQWDARDLLIRAELAAGAQDLVVPALDSIAALSEINSDPAYFVNRCSAPVLRPQHHSHGITLQHAKLAVHLINRQAGSEQFALLILDLKSRFHPQQHLVHDFRRDELHAVIIAENEIAWEDAHIVAQVTGQHDGHIYIGDHPPAKRVRRGAKGEDWEIRHFQHVLGVAAVPGDQHPAAAVGIGHLAAHLAKMGWLHIPAAVKDQDRSRLRFGHRPHHNLLRVTTLRLIFRVDCLAFFFGQFIPYQRVQLHRQRPAHQLHPLAQGAKTLRKHRVAHAQGVQRVRHAAAVTGPPVALNSLAVADFQVPNFLGGNAERSGFWHRIFLLRVLYRHLDMLHHRSYGALYPVADFNSHGDFSLARTCFSRHVQ